jgi:hypothetical protein
MLGTVETRKFMSEIRVNQVSWASFLELWTIFSTPQSWVTPSVADGFLGSTGPWAPESPLRADFAATVSLGQEV